MSMMSQICADEANAMRSKWMRALKKAIASRDWDAVKGVLKMMRQYVFTE